MTIFFFLIFHFPFSLCKLCCKIILNCLSFGCWGWSVWQRLTEAINILGGLLLVALAFFHIPKINFFDISGLSNGDICVVHTGVGVGGCSLI